MSLKQPFWTHASAGNAENHPTAAKHQIDGIFYRPTGEDTSRLHERFTFAVPTPTLQNGRKFYPSFATVRLQTSGTARVSLIYVYDGERELFGLRWPDVDLKLPNVDNIRYKIPCRNGGPPTMMYGINITVCIQFDKAGTDDWVRFYSVGMDLYS
ncbi:uncharacterized protein BDR25DRAFT_318235 [Lindgomyces ingoldianus]|uniref:Uncharacterized protein n=1 Tax=Lindgomyces ingoldianus TaxID=673940 RepID=A0ACB6QGZ4_9PLEO|nr:uncharacterized protein BDR25DRAFT_318235 [Lindgomyces ingoldianus]KAF2465775.1 hypothetical protein BDR25DRAFT_318235 [Lindgomyces ingoldianus]